MSAAEKFGAVVALDAPPAALPVDIPDVPDELLPDTDGEEDDGLVVDDDDCAKAKVENANKTAAVVVPRTLSMGEASGGWKTVPMQPQATCHDPFTGPYWSRVVGDRYSEGSRLGTFGGSGVAEACRRGASSAKASAGPA